MSAFETDKLLSTDQQLSTLVAHPLIVSDEIVEDVDSTNSMFSIEPQPQDESRSSLFLVEEQQPENIANLWPVALSTTETNDSDTDEATVEHADTD